MKRKLIVIVVIAAISLTNWQIVQSQLGAKSDWIARARKSRSIGIEPPSTDPELRQIPQIASGQVLASRSIGADRRAGNAAGPVAESQIIVAQYEWDGTHQISLADLKAAIADLPRYRRQNYETKAGKAKSLGEFIDEKLKLLEAIEKGFDKDAESLKEVESYKHQLMVKRLTEIEVDEKISYTEADLRAYYEAHKADYVEKEKSQASVICLTDRDRAQEVLDQIKRGKDIIEMAKELSEKRELTGPGSDEDEPGKEYPFTRSAYPHWPKFIDAVFEQEIGEMTEEVFEIEVGDRTYYMIFRKDTYTPERQKPFDKVKDDVEWEVDREKKRQRINEWVGAVSEAGRLKTYPDRIPAPSPEADTAAEKSKEKKTAIESSVIAEFEWDGKHQITLEEMRGEISELSEYKQKQHKGKAGLEEYMNLMAESRLILCLAKDRKFDEESEIVKKAQDYLHELMVDQVTELEVNQKLKLTEADYRLYYEAHKGDYVEPEQVRLTCIAFTNEERAAAVFQRITDGEDIAEIAKELSDKGELVGPGSDSETPGNTGDFPRGAFSEPTEPFVDAAFGLEVGQMNEEILIVDINTRTYYLIFRKEEHKAERQKALEEEDVHRSVESILERQKRDTLKSDWIAQLHERAKVKTFIDLIPETPEAAEESEGEPPATDDSPNATK